MSARKPVRRASDPGVVIYVSLVERETGEHKALVLYREEALVIGVGTIGWAVAAVLCLFSGHVGLGLALIVGNLAFVDWYVNKHCIGPAAEGEHADVCDDEEE